MPSDFFWDINGLFSQNLGHVFSLDGDELPVGSKKYLHAQGVVGLITWQDLGGHPYTGLYKGNTNGLIRLSEENFAPLPEATGLSPSIALKFPRTNKPSVNILAAGSFEPSTSFNFFKGPITPRMPPHSRKIEVQTIERKFVDWNRTIGAVGLSEFSRFTVGGVEVKPFVFPFDLRFAPDPAIATKFSDLREKNAAGVEIPWY